MSIYNCYCNITAQQVIVHIIIKQYIYQQIWTHLYAANQFMLDCFDRTHAWFIEITPVLLQSGSLVYQTASFRQECGRQLFYLPPSCFVLPGVDLENKIAGKGNNREYLFGYHCSYLFCGYCFLRRGYSNGMCFGRLLKLLRVRKC